MQNDWRLEIGDRMEEIRVKEYVSLKYSIVDSKKTSLPAPFALNNTWYYPCENWLLAASKTAGRVAGASQPGGEPGGDPERAEAAGAAAAAERGRAGREGADSAPARAPRDDGAAATQPGHTDS